MDKVSMSQMAEVISSVGPTFRALVAERDEALAKLAAYERHLEAEKVAAVWVQKGASNDPFEKVVEQLEKAAEKGELDVIRRALEFQGPDMGEKVARVVNDEPVSSDESMSTASGHDLVRFIVGDIG